MASVLKRSSVRGPLFFFWSHDPQEKSYRPPRGPQEHSPSFFWVRPHPLAPEFQSQSTFSCDPLISSSRAILRQFSYQPKPLEANILFSYHGTAYGSLKSRITISYRAPQVSGNSLTIEQFFFRRAITGAFQPYYLNGRALIAPVTALKSFEYAATFLSVSRVVLSPLQQPATQVSCDYQYDICRPTITVSRVQKATCLSLV